ncbi:MAG: AmmeMemoRadiSam system radical SAM enzyme [Candidatus Lindowbacteria bacterium]|nr:AmmeMemoRadiSam system radical SAM enzyme [Candidatus Lindowbacteria bacterium]
MSKRKLTRREFARKSCCMAAGMLVAAAPVWRTASAVASEQRCEGRHYKKLSGGRIQCFVCPLNCILEDGKTCFCQTRTNVGGTLYNFAYNNPCVLNVDPIEKGPLYHVLPGAQALALGTAGCNLRCLYCQNWAVSQRRPSQTRNFDLEARSIPAYARKKMCRVVSCTYTEPVAFYEYVYDIAAQARGAGLHTHVASAAFINPQPMRELCGVADSFTLALKGFNQEFYKKVCGTELAPVLDAMRVVKEQGRWLEIVTLIIPTLNDDAKSIEDECRWIADNLGANVPLHFARFYPEHRLKNLPPTPQSTLEQALKIGQEAGLKYVYLANLPGHPANNTYCPGCGKPVVKRVGLKTLSVDLSNGKCRFCRAPIPGIWTA